MRRFWSLLGLELGRRAAIVSVVAVVVTIGLGSGIRQLRFSTGQDSYLNKSDRAYKDNVAYQSVFGGDAMVTMFTMAPGHTVVDLADTANLAKLRAVETRLRADPGVFGVISPITALQFSNDLVTGAGGNPATSVAAKLLVGAIAAEPTAAGKAARLKDSIQTLQRAASVPPGNRTLDNPRWVSFLLYDNQGGIRPALRSFFIDNTHAEMLVRLRGNQSIADEGKAAHAVETIVAGTHLDGASVVTTGAPSLLRDINDYLRGGMLTLGAIALVIMALILVLLFNVRWRLLPLGIVVVGVIWAFGLAGYVHIPLTLATIAGLPVMLGIGIDYAIQMHSRIEEEVVIDRADHPIQEASRNLGPALLVVTFDAIFAFLALRFARVPMIRQFGLLLAVGIAVICVCSIILPLAILGIREYKSPTKGADYQGGRLARLVVWLGRLSPSAAVPLIVLSIVIFTGGALTEGRLVLQTDPVQWVNQHSTVIRNLNALKAGTGSSSELDVYVRSPGAFSDPVVSFVDRFDRAQLASHGAQLLPPADIVAVTSELADVPGAAPLVPTGADVRSVWASAPPDVQASTVSRDGLDLSVVFRASTGSLDQLAPVVAEMRAPRSEPAGTRATPAGIAVVGVGLLENLKANRVLLTYLAIGFVLVFLTLRLRSLVRALLSLVPVLIAVGTASLLAFALSLKLSPLTAVGGPLVVAACTEFTSLILLRFLEERRRGLAANQAIEVTAARTGRAFIVSALTAVAGVAVLSASSLPLLRGFGIIVAINVSVALLSALVVLPPLLVWAEGRGWVSRGMLAPEPLQAPPGVSSEPVAT